MAQTTEPVRAQAELALAVYLSPLAEGQRVLWVGPAGGGGPNHLARTARSVRVLSPASEKTRGRARVSSLKPGGLSFNPGSYDLVVVPDVTAVGMDREDRVDEVAEIVGDGLFVAGTAADDGVGYDDLYAMVARRFGQVQMLGQARFSGFTVVEFGGDVDAVTVDGSLIDEDDDRPVRYLAFGGAARRELDGYTVVRTQHLDAAVGGSAAAESPGTDSGVVELPVRRRSRSDSRHDEDRDAEQRQAEQLRAEQRQAEQRQAERRQAEQRQAMKIELDDQKTQLDAANEHAEALEASLADRSLELERAREALEVARTEIEQLEAETAEIASPDAELTDEYDRLERALRDRTRDLREARHEIERRGVLVRDVVEELAEMRRAPQSGGDATESRSAAVERALSAEAARAEAQFQVDELMGQLAAIDQELLTRLASREAELSGTVRGLRARVAELSELREIAEGRASLLDLDLDSSRERHLALERELSEVREQLELSIVREHSREHSQQNRVAVSVDSATAEPATAEPAALEELRASEQHLSQRVGELSGQLMACRDHAQHFETERDGARAETLRLTALVSSTETRLDGARRGYETRIAELLHDASASVPPPARSADLEPLRGEIEGLRARLADSEAAVAAASAKLTASEDDGDTSVSWDPARIESLEASLNAALDQADSLRKELTELNDKDSDTTVRLADSEELAELEAGRAADLTSTVAARDALITRLQMDLAELEQQSRDVEQRHGRLREENERLREALLHASERVDEVDGLERQLRELTTASGTDRQRADGLQSALEAARAELEQGREQSRALSTGTSTSLAELRESLTALLGDVESGSGEHSVEITAVGLDAPSGWSGPAEAAATASDLAIAHDRIGELERAGQDRDTLLRSLTAQLEERDDRIRALERRLEGEGSGDADAEAVRRELMELQERADRLSEELMHERRARRSAEAEAQKVAAGGNEGELKRLRGLIGDRDSEALSFRDKVDSRDRELKTVREAAIQTRAGLEELLGELTAGGDPGTAERVGALLRIMSRI